MKRVFTNSDDVIHLFAQRTQNDARCSNVFFEGNSIYSYGHHYELGRFIDDKAILINNEGYSVTTSKHINQLRYATRQYRQFFTMETDIYRVYPQIEELKKKLAVARKPEMYINEIFRLWEKMNEYLDYTKVKGIKTSSKYRQIRSLVKKLEQNPGYTKDQLAADAKKRETLRLRRLNRQLRESLAKFMNYEISTFRIGNEDYLRLSKDGQSVETSQGVKVSAREAKMLYNAILAGKDIEGYKIEYYTVTSINGTLKIGCHNINKESMHEIGAQLLDLKLSA